MDALLVSSDLMLSSQASGAASRAGCELRVVTNIAAGLEILSQQAIALVMLDLGTPGNEPAEVVPTLRAATENELAIVSFGPHVHKQRLEAARQAGCDMVISRGQFHSQAEEILRRYIPADNA